MTRKGGGRGWGYAVHGDLAFLHGLQQGRLGFGRGAVDFVGQHQLGGDGAGAEAELAGGLVIDGHAGDVAGQQVGSELDAGESAADGAGQGPGQHGLAHAGHVLHEDMTLGDEGGQALLDYVVLADDDGGHVVGDTLGHGGGVQDAGGDAGGVGGGCGILHGRAPGGRRRATTRVAPTHLMVARQFSTDAPFYGGSAGTAAAG